VDVRYKPAAFPHLRDRKVTSIACGSTHTLFLCCTPTHGHLALYKANSSSADGSLWGLGTTAYTQSVGDMFIADADKTHIPKEIRFFNEANITVYMIAAGGINNLALDCSFLVLCLFFNNNELPNYVSATGTVYKWNSYVSNIKDNRMKGLEGKQIVQMSCGMNHFVFVTVTGEVLAEGDNSCTSYLAIRLSLGSASLLQPTSADTINSTRQG